MVLSTFRSAKLYTYIDIKCIMSSFSSPSVSRLLNQLNIQLLFLFYKKFYFFLDYKKIYKKIKINIIVLILYPISIRIARRHQLDWLPISRRLWIAQHSPLILWLWQLSACFCLCALWRLKYLFSIIKQYLL